MKLAYAIVLTGSIACQLQCASLSRAAVYENRVVAIIDGRQDSVGAVERTRKNIGEIIKTSYPELKEADIRIKAFHSKSDYFKARFGVPQFFIGRMRFLVFVNPRVFELNAPREGLRAIVAHELGHVLYYRRGNRLHLVGLARLGSKDFTARFERWADLQAISRGYGPGLSDYRRWLYENVPREKIEEKRRNYFSPDEIAAILPAIQRRPELLAYWFKHVPRNMKEIQSEDRSGRR